MDHVLLSVVCGCPLTWIGNDDKLRTKAVTVFMICSSSVRTMNPATQNHDVAPPSLQKMGYSHNGRFAFPSNYSTSGMPEMVDSHHKFWIAPSAIFIVLVTKMAGVVAIRRHHSYAEGKCFYPPPNVNIQQFIDKDQLNKIGKFDNYLLGWIHVLSQS